MRNGGLHSIGARVQGFDYDISRILHDVGVVARPSIQSIFSEATYQAIASVTTREGIVPLPAVERVVACSRADAVGGGVAGYRVGQIIACAIHGCRAGERQVFDIRTEDVGNGSLHDIGARVQDFTDNISRIVHGVCVITRSATHRVGSSCAIDLIGASIAGEDVCHRVACGIDGRGPGEFEVFEIGCKCQRDRAANCIGAFVRVFRENIRRSIDDIEVVASTADQRIYAGSAVERVVAAETREAVVSSKSLQKIGR